MTTMGVTTGVDGRGASDDLGVLTSHALMWVFQI